MDPHTVQERGERAELDPEAQDGDLTCSNVEDVIVDMKTPPTRDGTDSSGSVEDGTDSVEGGTDSNSSVEGGTDSNGSIEEEIYVTDFLQEGG